MGIFDADITDPQQAMPLLGLLQGLGAASAPSYLPVTFGQGIGKAAEGLMGGLQGQQQATGGALDIALKQFQVAQWKALQDEAERRQALIDKGQSPSGTQASVNPMIAGPVATALASGATGTGAPPAVPAASTAAPAAPVAPVSTLTPTTPVKGKAGTLGAALTSDPNLDMAAVTGRILSPTGPEGWGQNPESSAAGPGQFLGPNPKGRTPEERKGTWVSIMDKIHPEFRARGMTDQQIADLRTGDPNVALSLARDATQYNSEQNAAGLQAAGLPVTAGTVYLSHLLGPDGAKKVLSAPPGTPLTSLLSSPVIEKNRLHGTNNDLVGWASKRMLDEQTAATTGAATGAAPTTDAIGGAVNAEAIPGGGQQATAPPTPLTGGATAGADATDGGAPDPDVIRRMLAASNPLANLTPQMLMALGPEGYARLAMSQKRMLSPEEVKALGFPKNSVILTDLMGNYTTVNKPPSRNLVPLSQWGVYGYDPALAGRGATLEVDEYGRPKLNQPNANMISQLDPQGRAAAVQEFIQTGRMPQGIRGAAAQDIWNYLGSLKPTDKNPDGTDKISMADWFTMIANKGLAYKARTNAAGRMEFSMDQTDVNEKTVENSINIVKNLMAKGGGSTGTFTDYNDFVQTVSRRLNSGDAAAFKNALETVSNDYARVMTGASGRVTDSARDEAHGRLLLGYNNNTLNDVMGNMVQEMHGRQAAYRDVIGKLYSGQTTGLGAVPINDAADQAAVQAGFANAGEVPTLDKIYMSPGPQAYQAMRAAAAGGGATGAAPAPAAAAPPAAAPAPAPAAAPAPKEPPAMLRANPPLKRGLHVVQRFAQGVLASDNHYYDWQGKLVK